ncbi:hypothetical transcript [Echinococcus multilocularis]|uniref:Hypothetical transcript n=1 Tax=Echinococcus multilocularis TaxID=6211 RepID=A0A068Y144_ECHMU|nr:hypothetical transcript [Echinococcus multilocularis]
MTQSWFPHAREMAIPMTNHITPSLQTAKRTASHIDNVDVTADFDISFDDHNEYTDISNGGVAVVVSQCEKPCIQLCGWPSLWWT